MGNIPPNRYSVTINVKSLSTNIPNSEGIAAVKNEYNNDPNNQRKNHISGINTFVK